MCDYCDYEDGMEPCECKMEVLAEWRDEVAELMRCDLVLIFQQEAIELVKPYYWGPFGPIYDEDERLKNYCKASYNECVIIGSENGFSYGEKQ